MAATPYPIPRGKRVTDVLAGNGGKVYGPFAFKIFDIDDVEVVARPQGAAKYSVAVVTVQKVSSATLDYFTITFPDNIPATTSFQVRGRRVAERSAGVLKGTMINPDALERELSKISLQAQEARRDALPLDPDIQEGDTVAWSASGWRKGANAADIAGAQVHAAAALASRQAAEGFAGAASASATSASVSASLSGRFATDPEDQEVIPSTGLFSAFHWAKKAMAAALVAAAGFAGAIHGAASKAPVADADEFGLSDSAASWGLKKVTLANLIASIFTATRTIADARFAAPTFRLLNAGGKALLANITGLTADRVLTVPDRDITLGNAPTYGALLTASTAVININSGIPADAKRITLNSKLSSGASMQPIIQLGTGGGLDTSGYIGGVQGILSGAGNGGLSAGFLLVNGNSAPGPFYGTIVLTRLDPSLNEWTMISQVSWGSAGGGGWCEGSKVLSGPLDRIQIGSTGGTVAFTGSVGIIVERF